MVERVVSTTTLFLQAVAIVITVVQTPRAARFVRKALWAAAAFAFFAALPIAAFKGWLESLDEKASHVTYVTGDKPADADHCYGGEMAGYCVDGHEWSLPREGSIDSTLKIEYPGEGTTPFAIKLPDAHRIFSDCPDASVDWIVRLNGKDLKKGTVKGTTDDHFNIPPTAGLIQIQARRSDALDCTATIALELLHRY